MFKEIEFVKLQWIKFIQKPLYEDNRYEKQLKHSLGIYFDTNRIVHCKGRLNKCDLDISSKNPILLPKNGHLILLVIREAHLKTTHGGVKDTLSEIRLQYWLNQGRQIVKYLIRRCALCQRLESKPFLKQIPNDLPASRVTCSFAFKSIGVDYLGPIFVKHVYNEYDDPPLFKAEIVLYMCAATRAVHLNLVPDFSSTYFIQTLKPRRGIPKLFISDNGTNFCSEEVKLSEELLIIGIKWQFIVEAAPWRGTFWKRLVQTVKGSLPNLLFKSTVKYDDLETIIIQIEGIVNSRLLTYMCKDDVEETITPSHLIYGRRILTSHNEHLDSDEELDSVKLS